MRGALTAVALLLASCGASPPTPSPQPAPAPSATFSSAHFTFHYTPIDSASIAATADALEGHYARVLDELGAEALPRVHVTLYADHPAMAAAVQPAAGMIPSWAGGLATSRDQIHLMSPNLPAWGPYNRALTNLVHEFAHCVSLYLNPAIANNPRWLWESVALYSARQLVDPHTLPYMRAAQPPSFQSLASIDNRAVYDVGYLIGEFIVDRWGRARLRELIVSNGNVAATMGMPLAAFEEQWLAFVRSRYGL